MSLTQAGRQSARDAWLTAPSAPPMQMALLGESGGLIASLPVNGLDWLQHGDALECTKIFGPAMDIPWLVANRALISGNEVLFSKPLGAPVLVEVGQTAAFTLRAP